MCAGGGGRTEVSREEVKESEGQVRKGEWEYPKTERENEEQEGKGRKEVGDYDRTGDQSRRVFQ